VLKLNSLLGVYFLPVETYAHALIMTMDGLSSQVVPEELVAMAERYEAWRIRKDSQRDENRGRPSRGGRRGRSRNESSFI